MISSMRSSSTPPLPSHLPSCARWRFCKRWRGLVTDPKFHRQFCANNGKPPLLGIFESHLRNPFRSILDPPSCIPPERFDLRRQTGRTGGLLGCRHGRVLLMDSLRDKIIVCDPITGEHRHIEAPPVFRGFDIYGDVLCATTEQVHVHGNYDSSTYMVVLMSLCKVKYTYIAEDDTPPIACVYSSETGIWGNIISTTDRCGFGESNPGVLIGNVLYWSSKSMNFGATLLYMEDFTDDIIQFDLDRQSLAVIKGPPCLNGSMRHQIIQADNGDVGLAIYSHGRLEMWQRKVNCHGGATWLLTKAVQMHIVLGLPPPIRGPQILGYDEDNGAIFFHGNANVYMIQLISMQFRKLYESDYVYRCHPFTSFYAPGEGSV